MLPTTITIDMILLALILLFVVGFLIVFVIHFLNLKRDSEKQKQELSLLRSEKLLNDKVMQLLQTNNLIPTADKQIVETAEVIDDRLSAISKKEKEVLQYEARGLSSKEIANQMNIAVNTVSNHFAHIKAKTGISTRAERVRFSIQNKLVS